MTSTNRMLGAEWEYGLKDKMWVIDNPLERITQQYLGKRVNPHLLRDIVASKWLETHPEDFLTIWKLLWHRNLKATLATHGRTYDESHANRRMEEWLGG